MKYVPKLISEDIVENHEYFIKRLSLYKERGLDFIKSREFILEKAYPLNGNILEVGTGRGHTTLALAKAGYYITSIDKDYEALKTTALNLIYEKLLPRVTFFIMDANSLSFESSSFNNVICVNLFHHIDKPNKVLSEIDRVLCTNGKLILADFNKRGMEIINSVHREEARIHKDSGIGKDYVYSYLHTLGYEIKNYEDRYHWVLIAKKKIQQ